MPVLRILREVFPQRTPVRVFTSGPLQIIRTYVLSTEKQMKAAADNRIVKGLDFAVDFATLGEYRLVTERPRRRVKEQELWAADLDWIQRPRTREVECSLPRARARTLRG
jgi:hypothetical protein